MKRCQQVVTDAPRRRCGKKANWIPGGIDTYLCPEHEQRLKSMLRRIYGIREHAEVNQ